VASPVFTISSARQRFFALFRAVTSRPGRRVTITSRGAAGHAVLVGESYLDELEAAARRLRELQAGQGMPAEAFRLLGSGTLAAGVEDPATRIRLEAATAAERKLASLTEGS